ncbi:toll-like receptor 3 [Coccinella septempunctata]|uniref:toll-like receptor 3 n=1 Tax=Coccinella septempunctata TaxID=41139 RepID=UPI001D093B11|nr:toll-like receptor 3 [Coccinella septempunctata]XP_044763210.1 toll-like receptor 3 [Coccinella septempunctata]XP_044763211.1 toll-like receptor 3 [Coccinella septempunctata]XP_044763212.1 toll-like receptor 3 [Coccinella septempunctata]XP_044763213.1 toll-like receptor 3 [Coccinella septempunctata]XP_044763214.1 toll-like receptor 3 [Coccinella septempunctata]XP_044763215.1 toll-like receptor 3 [Coccinella septempunctata]
MYSHALHYMIFFFFIHSTSSFFNDQRNIEDSTLTVPGQTCQSLKATYNLSLSYSFLKEKCTEIENKKSMKIQIGFDGIDENLFGSLKNMEILQVTSLNFTKIYFRTFNLRTIDLSHNEMKRIELIVYKNLKNLDLSYNKLSSIKLTPVEKEKSVLEILNISHNEIRKFDTISYFRNIKYLDLSWNKLEKLPKLPTKELRFLNLSFNELSYLSHSDLSSLKNLEYLDISYNNIRSLDGVLKTTLKNLKILDLRRCETNGLDYNELLRNYPSLEEVKTTNKTLECRVDLNDTKKTQPDSNNTCFSVSNSTKTCCCTMKKNIIKRSVPNSHFHATINNKKMTHNISGVASTTNSTATSEITLKDFFGKLHHLNVENVRTFLNVTLNKIDSSVSQLQNRYTNIINKIDSDMFLVNSKLDELNETFNDMLLEISNLDSGNGFNASQNTINPSSSFIDQNYEDIIYLLKLCLVLLLISVSLNIFRIVMRIRRSRMSKKYRMNLLNLESVEHH